MHLYIPGWKSTSTCLQTSADKRKQFHNAFDDIILTPTKISLRRMYVYTDTIPFLNAHYCNISTLFQSFGSNIWYSVSRLNEFGPRSRYSRIRVQCFDVPTIASWYLLSGSVHQVLQHCFSEYVYYVLTWTACKSWDVRCRVRQHHYMLYRSLGYIYIYIYNSWRQWYYTWTRPPSGCFQVSFISILKKMDGPRIKGRVY